MKYKDSGVDIDAASDALAGVRASIARTWGPEVASDVGSFGGLFRQPDGSFLVSSIDGVGTKLLVALQADLVDGVGADLLNHCVNDILVQGASPLFFLDYFAAGRLNPDHFARVVEGMAEACAQNGCALIGGETAEMPGVYQEDDFDLAGCIVGRVSPAELITGEKVAVGMKAYAWPSTGLHTNGYSLARRALIDGPQGLDLLAPHPDLGGSVAEALLAVHRSYLAEVRELRELQPIAGLCHITGGGLIDNLPRILPDAAAIELDASRWDVPAIFQLIAARGQVDVDEMRRVFNVGLGMIAILPELPKEALRSLTARPVEVGEIVPREGGDAVRFVGRHVGL